MQSTATASEQTAGPSTRWSDDSFLDKLGDVGDSAADRCVATLPPDQSLAFLFTKLHSAADEPSVLPAAFVEFCKTAGPSLDLSDLTAAEQQQLRRGQQVFMTTAMPMALCLLTKSLQEGYQAPRLGKVLMMSGELESSTYRRVLGVLQMLIAVATPGSFEPALKSDVLPATDAALTAVRVRLMHAGLRGIARGKFPDFARQYGGVPISLEDMLATLIAFSLLVNDGLETLKMPMSPEDAEAYHAVWRVFARCMGIHPPGEPKSWAWIPASLAEARDFYASYSRRHYRPAAENEEGVMLAAANLRMLSRRMPFFAARIFMHALMGPEASDRLGIRAVPLLFLWKATLLNFPHVWTALWRALDKRSASGLVRHIDFSEDILQRLVVFSYEEKVPSLCIPRDVTEISQIVRGTSPGLEYGREQFRREVFPTELADVTARRTALGLDATRLTGAPSTSQGIVGLALSGGGIRSASFALGAVQALARRHCLRFVDYMSTVSGGGYTGAAISSVLNDPDASPDGRAFAFNTEAGEIEPPALRHVRSGSNYLAGGGLVQNVRLPMVLLRGIMLNTLLFMPYVMIATIVTWILFPWMHLNDFPRVFFWTALLVFLTVTCSYPAVTWLRMQFRWTRTWKQRNRTELLQAFTLILFAGAVVFSMLTRPIAWAIVSNWTKAKELLNAALRTPAQIEDYWKWMLGLVVIWALLNVGKASKALGNWTSRAMIYVLGMLGYGVVFGSYLLLLVAFARSPFLSAKYAVALSEAASRPTAACPACGTPTSRLLAALRSRDVNFDSARVVVTSLGPQRWLVGERENPGFNTRRPIEIGLHDGFLEIANDRFGEHPADWAFATLTAVLFLLNALWVDVNITSAHGFFRDRLSRVFLIRARWFGKTQPNDNLKLSELASRNAAAPYHILNTTLNLAGSHVEDLPGRRADFFMLSRRYVGSYSTGYAQTTAVEDIDANLDLGTAMAISAAAASPNAGTTTVRPLVFLLTLLNVRLGYWLPNPWYVQATQIVRRLMVRSRPGPWFLLREALQLMNAKSAFVNISDGGHLENLAIYELLRRRCRLVIAVDAECDLAMNCPSLATVIRYAQIDLGIEIDIPLAPLQLKSDGLVADHWTVGTIDYGGGESGILLYIKSSLTGDEPPYVSDYRRRYPTFPHESTSDQFFNEAQFESYRALGFHSMNKALAAATFVDAASGDDRSGLLRQIRDLLQVS